MNDTTTVMSLILGIGILVTLLMVVFLRKNKKEAKKGETNYRAFFIMGAAFLPTGIAMMLAYFLTELPFEIGLPLVALGLIYLIIGLVNRDKWKNTT